MRFINCTVCCLLLLASLQAQRFGGHPPAVRWQQVNNEAVKVIFPKGLDTAAERVAAISAALRSNTAGSIGPRQQKVSIVLQPNTIVSNGYVALGPFRSEFYLTPLQNSFELGSIRWQDVLSTHEYRHIQQYNNFNVGLSHVFRILFGQNGQELANGAAIPNWFWEGDAVFQETLVSEQGRGRLPFFFNDYRALWQAGKHYSYMKLRNGSLRDFTPDHYRLGYMLVAYGRQQYGDVFWKKVTQDAASYKGLFYPFQQAVKRHSGKTFTDFTHDAFDYFSKQAAPDKITVPSAKHFLADQEFPVRTGGDTIVYVNTSYTTLPAFIEKTGSTERLIRVKDVGIDNQFDYAAGKIVYASYRPALRWGWNDYNELQVLDVASGHQQTITHRSKYFSPAFNADGSMIAAVEVKGGGPGQLHLLNAATGSLLKVIPNPDSLFYTYPKFINQDQLVVAVRKPSGRMAMAMVNTGNGAVEYLTPDALRVVGFPAVQHDTVYFTAAGNGYDRLFAITLNNKKIYQLNVRTNGIGAYQPNVSAGKLLFSSFTADGFRIRETAPAADEWTAVDEAAWRQPIDTFNINLSSNSAAGLLGAVKVEPLQSAKYAQTSGLFNFHSLLPYITDPDYRLSLVGNNVLNTMQSEIYGAYNRNEQYKQLGGLFTYGGLFPHINLGANYIFDRRDFNAANKPIYWNEGQANAGLSIPLNLSKGRSLAYLTIGSDYVLKAVSYKGAYKDTLGSSQLGYINGYISFSHQVQQARQHIYPRLAQVVYLNYRTAVQSVTARQFLASGSFYFPGLARTHNIVFNLAFQHRDTLNQYRYSNSFPFSRGYESPNLRNMYKWGVNYHLPIAYPDFGVANIVYFQRVRANMFYDYTVGKVAYSNGARLNTAFRSTGIEIFFDTKWWNELPLNFGFRYSYLLDRDLFGGLGANRFEFVLPVNLFQR
jgi:hypothetical protein